ncbi:unnamed protein product [Paramecium pentaurelia]|uniref:Calcium-transporting ATPase n=1 Tax=Paramecium pentaurelia TaxID=43138 RepID=A0A8S1VS12_9CILI|nr:unnamed protein product [Paramecium pentaurelia]
MSRVNLIEKNSDSELVRQGEDGDFKNLFILDNIRDGVSLGLVQQLGGEQGLAKIFQVDLKRGVEDEEQVITLRNRYGANLPIVKELTPLWKLIVECLGDTMLQILIVAAIVSTILGIIENEGGWYEGLTIFLAIFLIIGITAGNNYAKERQFAKLQSKLDEGHVQVKRGGNIITINNKDIVVGDVLLFQLGDIFNVDGLYLHGSEVKIDESAMTGESDEMQKASVEVCLKDQKGKSPFLMSGTKVNEGTGIMLVLQVGYKTVQNEMKRLGESDNTPTPLQVKLEAVAETIGKVGVVVAILTFIILLVRLFIEYGTNDNLTFWEQFWHIDCLQKILKFFMIGVTIIVVAVPEGLPLAVTITLAFSVNKMKDEQNLVKTLASCEIMGGVNNICSDKTGTLTLNTMQVNTFFCQGVNYKDYQLPQIKNLQKDYLDLLAASNLYNSSAYPKKGINGKFEQIGNKTECALIEFCDMLGYQLSSYRPSDNILRVIPLNSKRKMMISIVHHNDKIYLFSKGAPEMVLKKCSKFINSNGEEVKLTSQDINNMLQIIEDYASQALRTLGNAYKLLNYHLEYDFDSIPEEYLLNDLTLLNIAGIKDPVRPDVPSAIQQCYRSGIIVRMVTGDNINTAKAIARDCKILGPDNELHEYEAMEGSQFRQLTGGLNKVIKDGVEVQEVKNLQNFQEIAVHLKVLARATPEDKFILATGLKQLDNVIAVTGDGTNDAPALRKADVGFAMGITGTDVCKDAADIILLDDNFSSIITACKWGRNIYNCIRKFIQFQLTVNVVALFMSVLGAAVTKEAPLTSIQMLWVNLIMDTFASLALATEPPSDRLLNRKPYGKRESIVNSIMYRTVIGASIYQILILCLILFISNSVFDFDESLDVEYEGRPIQRLTMFFQTFVLMQICNSISCRKLDEVSLNPFSGLFNNSLFWLINLIEVGVQYLLILFGDKFAVVCDLTAWQHIFCWIFALGGMIVAIFVRTLPSKWFNGINIFAEEEIEEEKLDETIASKLRRKISVRIGSVLDDNHENKRSIQKRLSIYKE